MALAFPAGFFADEGLRAVQLLSLCGDLCPTKDVWDWAVYSVCHPHIHSEIRFADGRCFSAEGGVGVRWKLEIDTAHPWWDVIDLPWKETGVVLAWCDSQVGMPYNWIGAINSGLGLDFTRAGEWFCSQLAIEIMSRCGAIGIPSLLSPEALYRWITGTLAGESRAALVAECNVLESSNAGRYKWLKRLL